MPISRFLLPLFAWVVVFSVLTGAAVTLQFAFGLSKFGGLEYLPRVVWLQFVRELPGGVSLTAALFAWVTATHSSDLVAVRREFRPIARTALATMPLAELAAITVGLGTSQLIYVFGYGKSAQGFWSEGSRILNLNDLGVGFFGLLMSAAMLVVAGYVVVPRMTRLPWSLPAKLGAVWLVILALRVALSVGGSLAA